MTKRVPRRTERLTFPALSSFAKGYLHEDLLEVHGSAPAAMAAFCAEAEPAERRQLADELASFIGAAAHQSPRDLRRFVTRELGSRWAPRSRADLVELLDLLRGC